MKTTKLTALFITTILIIGLFMTTVTNAIATETYDLVILNCLVMDP